jgi:hypothetical protein
METSRRHLLWSRQRLERLPVAEMVVDNLPTKPDLVIAV